MLKSDVNNRKIINSIQILIKNLITISECRGLHSRLVVFDFFLFAAHNYIKYIKNIALFIHFNGKLRLSSMLPQVGNRYSIRINLVLQPLGGKTVGKIFGLLWTKMATLLSGKQRIVEIQACDWHLII